jgi:hypothetical protein
MDTLINPRAVAGDNQPPLAERLAADHADLKKRADEAAELVPDELRSIASDEEADAYTETARTIKDVIADADKAFEPEKEPWRVGGKTVDDFFRFRSTLEAKAKKVVAAISTWQTAKLAAQRKADAEAAEAARKAAEAENERLRKEAEAFDEEPPPVVQAPWVPPVVAKEAVRVVTSSGAKASGSLKWDYEIVKADELPRDLLIPNLPAIKARVDALKANGTKLEDAKIAGVRIFERVQTAIRR